MEELETIKAFAKLEGLAFRDVKGNCHNTFGLWCSIYPNNCYGWYNPLNDFTLTFKAMVKYKVQKITEVYNGVEFNTFHIGGEYRVSVSDDNLIPEAIIGCILKSEGVVL